MFECYVVESKHVRSVNASHCSNAYRHIAFQVDSKEFFLFYVDAVLICADTNKLYWMWMRSELLFSMEVITEFSV